METQSIVVLDFGAQYSQLIARRIREQNVFSVVLPCTATLDEIRSYSPLGIILSGGPCSVYDQDAPNTDRRVFELGLPVLGICYGLQLMVHVLGGKVRAADKREYGHASVEIKDGSLLFQSVPKKLSVWMSHGDEAVDLPAGFRLTASSPNAVAAIENPEKKMWAVQFHPEVRHTQSGTDILRNFALVICGAKPTWTPQHFIDATIANVRHAQNEVAVRAVTRGDDLALSIDFTLASVIDRSDHRDPVAIDSYIGKGPKFAAELGRFARQYADQNARDHAQLVRAIADGTIESLPDSNTP